MTFPTPPSNGEAQDRIAEYLRIHRQMGGTDQQVVVSAYADSYTQPASIRAVDLASLLADCVWLGENLHKVSDQRNKCSIEADRLRAAISGEGDCTCRHWAGADGEYGGTDEDDLCPEHGIVGTLRGSHEYAVRSEGALAKALGMDNSANPFGPSAVDVAVKQLAQLETTRAELAKANRMLVEASGTEQALTDLRREAELERDRLRAALAARTTELETARVYGGDVARQLAEARADADKLRGELAQALLLLRSAARAVHHRCELGYADIRRCEDADCNTWAHMLDRHGLLPQEWGSDWATHAGAAATPTAAPKGTHETSTPAVAQPDHCGLCGSESCPGRPGEGCMPGPFEPVSPVDVAAVAHVEALGVVAEVYAPFEDDDAHAGQTGSSADVEPQRLINALTANGWNIVGQRAGAYVRLALPDADRISWVVPLDESAGDFADLMDSAFACLKRDAKQGRRAAAVLDTLRAVAGTGQQDTATCGAICPEVNAITCTEPPGHEPVLIDCGHPVGVVPLAHYSEAYATGWNPGTAWFSGVKRAAVPPAADKATCCNRHVAIDKPQACDTAQFDGNEPCCDNCPDWQRDEQPAADKADGSAK